MISRPYNPDDLATVQEWAKERGMVIPAWAVPPDAFIVEDEQGLLAFACLYFRIFCPVCSIDHFTARPGLHGVQVLEAYKLIEASAIRRIETLREIGEADYRLFETFVDSRLAEQMPSLGYEVGSKNHVFICKVIP